MAWSKKRCRRAYKASNDFDYRLSHAKVYIRLDCAKIIIESVYDIQKATMIKINYQTMNIFY